LSGGSPTPVGWVGGWLVLGAVAATSGAELVCGDPACWTSSAPWGSFNALIALAHRAVGVLATLLLFRSWLTSRDPAMGLATACMLVSVSLTPLGEASLWEPVWRMGRDFAGFGALFASAWGTFGLGRPTHASNGMRVVWVSILFVVALHVIGDATTARGACDGWPLCEPVDAALAHLEVARRASLGLAAGGASLVMLLEREGSAAVALRVAVRLAWMSVAVDAAATMTQAPELLVLSRVLPAALVVCSAWVLSSTSVEVDPSAARRDIRGAAAPHSPLNERAVRSRGTT